MSFAIGEAPRSAVRRADISFSDDGIMPLFCPTRQRLFVKYEIMPPMAKTPLSAWGN